MRNPAPTLISLLVLILLGALAVPSASALDKVVAEAVVAGDWDKVVELITPTLKFGGDMPSRLLMVQACRATNRNNTAERQLDVEPTNEDRVAWFLWLDSLAKEHPESPAVHSLWADARYRARRAEGYRDEPVSRSLASVSRAIDLDSDNAFAFMTRGDIYLAERRQEHALTDFKKALELDPKLVEAQFSLGVVYEREEKFERAIEEYTKAIEMSPTFAKALTFRGAVYRELDSINQAIEDCNAALQADDRYVLAHFVKGMTYYQADMGEMATKSFQAFVDTAPPKYARMARNAKARIKLIEEDY